MLTDLITILTKLKAQDMNIAESREVWLPPKPALVTCPQW